jgi:pyrroloquinoline quinone (PQQ) biosynthesis protein C
MQVLAPGVSASAVALAAERLEQLAETARSDPDANAEYQRVIYHLQVSRDTSTHDAGTWLVSRAFAAENRHMPAVEPFDALPTAEFKARMSEELSRDRSTTVHEASRRLFDGPTRPEEARIYFQHHWHRSQWFYRDITHFALRFMNVSDSSSLYENLFDETGGGNGDVAHPRLLARLNDYFDISVTEPTETHSFEYLNFRARCLRNPNVEWGLAYMFALEQGTPMLHVRVLKMLERLGVPEHAREFHKIHTSVDVKHSDDIGKLLGKYAITSSAQQTCVSVLRKYLAVRANYFERVWASIAAAQQRH